MELCSIASGSSGNCIYVSGDHTRLLIDTGLSKKRILNGLAGIDVGPDELDGILNKIVNKKIQAKKKVFFTEIIEKNNGSAMAKYLGAWKKVPISTLDEYINKASAQNSTEVVAVLMEYKNKLYSTDDVAAHETKKTEQELGMRERSFREWQKVFKLTEAYVDNGLIIAKYRGEDAVVEIRVGIMAVHNSISAA